MKVKMMRMNGVYVTDVDYADDIALLAHSIQNAVRMLNLADKYASLTGLRINSKKTLAMILPTPDIAPQPIALSTGSIDWTDKFNYLGSIVPHSEDDLNNRIRLARLQVI